MRRRSMLRCPKLQLPDGRGVEAAEFSGELEAGRQLYLFYADDPGIWHAALLLYPEGADWHILTPDGDVYLEDVCAATGETVEKAALCQMDRSPPTGLPGKLYQFRRPIEDAQLRLYMEELRDQMPAGTAGPRRWIGQRGEAHDARPPVAERRVVPAPRQEPEEFAMTPDRRQGGAGSSADHLAEDLRGGSWMTLEETEVRGRYSLVEPKSTDVLRGRRGLCMLSGTWTAVAYLTESERQEKEVLTLDNRILEPVVYNGQGQRSLDFGVAISKMKEEPMGDFPLKSRRSLGWLLQYVRDHGTTFDGRQSRWATEQKIDSESAVYVFHDLVGFALELGATYDQLDMVNLASFELLGRVYQMIEQTRGQMTTEGLDHYIGRDSTGGVRRGIALAPNLAEDAVAKQARETEILKQERKAREERALAKAKGGNANNSKK